MANTTFEFFEVVRTTEGAIHVTVDNSATFGVHAKALDKKTGDPNWKQDLVARIERHLGRELSPKESADLAKKV